MGKKNSLWLQKHRKDHYFKLAKERGYRSRSAFKLLQISRNCNLLKQGKKIVDLGASPGGWIQVARDFVGDDGFILGIDKKPEKLGSHRYSGFLGSVPLPSWFPGKGESQFRSTACTPGCPGRDRSVFRP